MTEATMNRSTARRWTRRWLARCAPVLFGVAMVTMANAPAAAIEYPWCADYNLRGGATNCGFMTWEQCRATVSGVGGYCRQNPFYRGQALNSGVIYGPRHTKKKKRRHVH
jgi:uncharacterized protein DUF3551